MALWVINRDQVHDDLWVLGQFYDEPNAHHGYDYGHKICEHSYVRSALMVLLADYCIRQHLDPAEYEMEVYTQQGQKLDPAWNGAEYAARVAQDDRLRLIFMVKPKAGKES